MLDYLTSHIWFTVSKLCHVIVEMLQKLEQASEAAVKLSEVDASNESHSISYAADTDEHGVQQEHGLDVSMVTSTSRDDDDTGHNDAASCSDVMDDRRSPSIDGISPSSAQCDLEANVNSEMPCHSTVCNEISCSDQQASKDIDQCTVVKSEPAHSSPCTASADDVDALKAPGISL